MGKLALEEVLIEARQDWPRRESWSGYQSGQSEQDCISQALQRNRSNGIDACKEVSYRDWPVQVWKLRSP